QHVVDAVVRVYERGFWRELVPLIVPGFNDDDAQLRRAADYIASVSPEIPWHVTAFHKDYRMTDPDNTSAETLLRACEIGAAAGLKFVYAGNLPGRVGRWEHTWCPDCGELLIERHGYVIQQQRIGVGADGVAVEPGRGSGQHHVRPGLAHQSRRDHDLPHAARGAGAGAPGRARFDVHRRAQRTADGGDHYPPAPDAHVGVPRRHPGPGAQGHPRQRSAHDARAARDAPGP